MAPYYYVLKENTEEVLAKAQRREVVVSGNCYYFKIFVLNIMRLE
jgi:hypothetical protein